VYRGALFGGVVTAALTAPGLAAAQDSQGGSSGGVPLPEIRVIGTSPVPPPRQAPRPRGGYGGAGSAGDTDTDTDGRSRTRRGRTGQDPIQRPNGSGFRLRVREVAGPFAIAGPVAARCLAK
jgi:hypothetical protein